MPPPTPSAGADVLLEPIGVLAARLSTGELTSIGLTRQTLDRISEHDRRLNAFIEVTAALAEAQAQAADDARHRGVAGGLLAGIPISLKDLIDLEGVRTTAASRVRRDAVAATNAPVVSRLLAARAVVVGKTNLHEFAFGTTSEESAYGAVRNPFDVGRSAGGSSGGSAVAVATGMSAASVGTDTGGSIRIPSAACGLVGLKPGFGEVPTAGIVPLAWSLDHAGPIAKTVSDAAALFEVLADVTLPAPAYEEVRGRRIGVPRRYFFDVLEPEVRAGIEAALARLAAAGAIVSDVDVEHVQLTAPVYLLTSFPEAAAYHGPTLETRAEDYTPPVRLRAEAARYVLAEDYVRAHRGRAVLTHDVDRALAGLDALALPTLPILAPPLGAATVSFGERVETVRNLMLRLTQLFNVTGHPALTLPAAAAANGLPVGLQLVGHRGRTAALLDLGRAVERQLGRGPAPVLR